MNNVKYQSSNGKYAVFNARIFDIRSFDIDLVFGF